VVIFRKATGHAWLAALGLENIRNGDTVDSEVVERQFLFALENHPGII
jgi:hypothetical protein